MPWRPQTKPCPSCGKPLKPQAPTCWFCGAVFDTEPCPHCGTPVKRSSSHCGFCGLPVRTEVSPSPPQAAGAPDREPDLPPSEAIQAAPPTSGPGIQSPVLEVTGNRDCPRCGEEIPLAAVRCKHCGAPLHEDGGRDRPRWRAGHVRAPHRGGSILALAVAGIFCCGIVLGPVAVVMAITDLSAMRACRMDDSGEGLTWAGLVIGIFATVASAAVLTLRLAALPR